MPQIFQVLRCYKCSIFQVHQTKKSNKFQCKVCSEKQSIKRHYGLGTAKDCRLHVQKLNGIKGDIDESKINQISSSAEGSEEENVPIKSIENNISKGKESKWSHYIEKANEVQKANDEEEMRLNDMKVVLEVPKKLKRVHNTSRYSKSKRGNFSCTYSNRNTIQDNTDDIHDNVATILSNPPSPPSESKLNFKPILIKDQNESKTIAKKNFAPVALNKSSKWAQFAVEDEDEENFDTIEDCSRKSPNDSEENIGNITQKNLKNCQYLTQESKTIKMPTNKLLFSQCDDSQLDDLLDI